VLEARTKEASRAISMDILQFPARGLVISGARASTILGGRDIDEARPRRADDRPGSLAHV
jgi:hypothetical protein